MKRISTMSPFARSPFARSPFALVASSALIGLLACGSPQQSTSQTASEQKSDSAKAVTDSGFTLKDLNGAEVSLASYQGKTVVLEWFNPGCPFIVYAHGEGPLKDMAGKVAEGGDVAWLAINSSAKGKGADLAFNKQSATDWNIPHPILMDPTGEVGRKYGAKTTPHMFILDGTGAVVYKGALDNAPRGQPEGEYVNYVAAALDDLAAGRPVANPETKSYGCSVKY